MKRSGVVLLLGGVALMASWQTVRARHDTVQDLVRRSQPNDEPTLWYVFRVADCSQRSTLFDTLSAIAAAKRVVVRGVMMEGPADTSIGRQLVAQFGARFPVELDRDRQWIRALESQADGGPLFILQQGPVISIVSARSRDGDKLLRRYATMNVRIASRLSATPERRYKDAPELKRSSRIDFKVGRPEVIRSGDRHIFVIDYDSVVLRAFDGDGTLLWRRDRGTAQGPVFNNPIDLRIGRERVELLDPQVRTLWSFNKNGDLKARSHVSRTIRQLVRRSDGNLIGFLPSGSPSLAIQMDSAGLFVRELEGPAPLKGMFPLLREARVATLPGSDSVAMVFRWAGRLLVYDPYTSVGDLVEMIEPLPFPRVLSWKHPDGATSVRVDPSAVEAAVDVTADRQFIYVLFSGSDGVPNKVDAYARGTGSYVASYRFPIPLAGIAAYEDGLATISVRDGTRTIDRWRIRK